MRTTTAITSIAPMMIIAQMKPGVIGAGTAGAAGMVIVVAGAGAGAVTVICGAGTCVMVIGAGAVIIGAGACVITTGGTTSGSSAMVKARRADHGLSSGVVDLTCQ